MLALKNYIGDYASSEYFAFLSATMKNHAEALLRHFLDEAQSATSGSVAEFDAPLCEKLLLEKIAGLDLSVEVRQGVPHLLEEFFDYLAATGKYPAAREWAAWMPEIGTSYAQRFREDGSVKGETVRLKLDKVGRNDPCPCGSGKKFKKCCIELLS
jgi:uncharacterized protein YecA (UPF0149 family)